MDDGYQLLDASAAQAFFRRFPGEVQKRGHAFFQESRVASLSVVTPGSTYSAVVQGPTGNDAVTLSCDPLHGWSGTCSCPAGPVCQHIAAAMLALLAEHRMAVVRQLSTGQAGSSAAMAGLKARPDIGEPENLRALLRSRLGRALTRPELRFLDQLSAVYQRASQTRQISYGDLQRLGFYTGDYAWNLLKIWPAFPATEQDFWLYIANFLNEHDVQIPEFMAAVTDLASISERLARWRRADEIERWKKRFGSIRPVREHAGIEGEIDLRVMIEGPIMRLQWMPPGQTDFFPLKQPQYRQLEIDYNEARVSFPDEAELLWELFRAAVAHGVKLDLDAFDPEVDRVAGRLLRSRSLESRTVDATGHPLKRFAEPLRWQVGPADGHPEDYQIRLVQNDGSSPPEIVRVLQGSPTLYLTAAGVFEGPVPMERQVDTGRENRIPAPALESAGGVAFLEVLGAELPTKLKDRVKKLPWQIHITCALRPLYAGSDLEECLVTALAEAPDGRQQTWTGFSWSETKESATQKKREHDSTITVYDSKAQAEVARLLEPLNLKPTQYGNQLAMRVSKRFADRFTNWLKTVPTHIRVNLEGELASLSSGEVAGRVKLDVQEREIDWFDLRVVLDVEDTTLSTEEIKLLLNAKGRYVRLQGKGWRRLHYDLSEEENDRLARLGLSPRELSAEPQKLHALQLANDAAKKFLPPEQVEQVQRRAREIKARVAPELPAEIHADLRPYQVEGFHFLAYLAVNRFGGILADDMGLGKTLQTLAWLVWLRQSELCAAEPPAPTLVVCPKSVMDNWHAEAGRFAPGLRVRAWPANELPNMVEKLHTAEVHVLNYSQLRSLGESLLTIRWLALILDEGQYIKNPNSQTAQVARALQARFRLVLSGTPIENHLLDLWSLMAFAMPGVLGSRAQFARLYDAKDDPLGHRRLAARVRPFLLRRTKAQVAHDLPDRIEEDLFCEMEGEQQVLYRAELKAAQQLLLSINTQKELAQKQFHFLTSLLRLRQICCHPRLLQPESSAPSAKTESLLEQLELLMEEGQKVLVFSQFVQMLDLLRPELERRGWPVFYLAGHTENRGELVRGFQESAGAGVFLISLKAGGFGLNLTAASYVMLFDPWWNPAVENQAIDRTHRIGQTRKVIAYRLLIKNSIEEKIRDLQKHKKALAQDIFGEEQFAQSLTLEDLRFLLSD